MIERAERTEAMVFPTRGKPYKFRLPQLSQLQLAALAAVRDDEVRYTPMRLGYREVVKYTAHRFDVTYQMRSLRKRWLIRYNPQYRRSRNVTHFVLTKAGAERLAQHPEF